MGLIDDFKKNGLLSERVVTKEDDSGGSENVPAVDPSAAQNIIPADGGPTSSEPTGGKVGSSNSTDVNTGGVQNDQKPPVDDAKKILVEECYYSVAVANSLLKSLANETEYVGTKYGPEKLKYVGESAGKLAEMRSMLSEMYNGAGATGSEGEVVTTTPPPAQTPDDSVPPVSPTMAQGQVK